MHIPRHALFHSITSSNPRKCARYAIARGVTKVSVQSSTLPPIFFRSFSLNSFYSDSSHAMAEDGRPRRHRSVKSKDNYTLQFRPVNLLGLLQVGMALLLHDSALAFRASCPSTGACPQQEDYSRCTPLRLGPGPECKYTTFVASHLSDVLP